MKPIAKTVITALLLMVSIFKPVWAKSSQPPQHTEQITIAVIEFEGKGLSQLEASTLTDRLRTALVQTGEVIVVERSLMEDLLQESGFQQTGCVSTECAVEVGKILGVQEIITGGIGRLGKTYTIDARIIDVQTSRISKVASRDYTGEIDGLLSVIRDIGFDLVGEVSTVAEPVQLQSQSRSEQLVEKRGQSKLLWLGVGAVVAGVTAYYFLSQEETNTGSVTVSISIP